MNQLIKDSEKKKEITDIDDIRLMVRTFYNKVREDDLLKDIFINTIGDHWPEHLDKLYRFWQTVLLEEHAYYGSPFPPHAKLDINKTHFNKWLILFNQTIDELFTGEKAEKAKMQAKRMAEMFNSKIDYYKTIQS